MHISRVIRRNTYAGSVSHFREYVESRELPAHLSRGVCVLARTYIKLNGRVHVVEYLYTLR